MATSVKEIYDSIITYKDSREELKDLNSTSLVSIYTMWAYVTSVVIYTHELLWDLFRAEIETSISERINGTSGWYTQKALEFQLNDDVQVLDGGTRLGYDPVIEDNRIITRAAYQDNGDGILNIKLAKGSPSSLEALDPEEESSVEKYFEKIKFAGTQINVISIQPDEIVLDDVIVHHDGVRTSAKVEEDVNTAMDDFLVNLPFNGLFYVEKFRDSIQAVEGVVDVEISSPSGLLRISYLSGSPVTSNIPRKIVLDAGYGIISTTGNNLSVLVES